MDRKNVKYLTFGALAIALSQSLSYIKIFRMPQGGSVTIASTLPIIIFCSIASKKYAFLASFIYGFLQFVLGGLGIHPVSIFLDYILAYGVLGIISFFKDDKLSKTLGVAVAFFIRYILHFISGVTIFRSYAPKGMHPIIYSASYNSFLVPEFLITGIIFYLAYDSIKKAIKDTL